MMAWLSSVSFMGRNLSFNRHRGAAIWRSRAEGKSGVGTSDEAALSDLR